MDSVFKMLYIEEVNDIDIEKVISHYQVEIIRLKQETLNG